MKFINITDYKYSHLHYIQSGTDALVLTKPVDPEGTLRRFPQLKAIEIEFDKTAFKKDFDSAAFIGGLQKFSTLELLQISGERKMIRLPDVVAQNGLRFLNASVHAVEDFGNILPKMTALEQLQLNFIRASLGHGLHTLTNLRMLKISANEVVDLESICDLPNLEYLFLDIKNLPALPNDFAKLKKLKHLTLYNGNLKEFPHNLHLPHLETLDLYRLPELEHVPASILPETLTSLTIYGSNKTPFTLPPSLSLPNLRDLRLESLNLQHIPELSVPSLEKLTIEKLPAKQICSRIKNATEVTEISFMDLKPEGDDIRFLPCKKVTKYRGPVFSNNTSMDFGIWPELRELSLWPGDDDAFELVKNQALEKVLIRGNSAMKVLPALPESIVEIRIDECSALEYIDLSDKSYGFRYIHITGNFSLSRLMVPGKNLPKLYMLEITGSPKLQQLPVDLFQAPELGNIRTSKTHPDLIDADAESITDLLETLKKSNASASEREAAAYWFLKKYLYEQPPHEILVASISLLRIANDGIYKLVAKNLQYFNPENKTLVSFSPAAIEGKKIAIVGNTFDSKTAIKENIKQLNALVTTNAQEADFILLAKKVETGVPLGGAPIFFQESDLNQYLDTHKPKFLKQETVTGEHITNLRRILWSTDPNTELMALEMLKKGGLPDEVIGECIAIAKTSIDKTVKDKYKKFLKGNVPPEVFDIVSLNIRFDLSNPFYKLRGTYSDALLGKLAMALYQRTKNFWDDTLELHHADFDLRKEIIQNHVVPRVLERPHYLDLRHGLTHDELKDVLSLPQLKGELKRLIISVSYSDLPEVIGEYTTLKELNIQGNLSAATVPALIYKLKRLSDLNISSDTLEVLDEQIGQLKELKTLRIYNKKPMRVSGLKALPKLKDLYFSGDVLES
jgi:Leucine-rich repeat (LRR) protein